jgi:hypothetical protein
MMMRYGYKTTGTEVRDWDEVILGAQRKDIEANYTWMV